MGRRPGAHIHGARMRQPAPETKWAPADFFGGSDAASAKTAPRSGCIFGRRTVPAAPGRMAEKQPGT